MIIVHNEAGLGNQMMDWAEYYLLKKINPNQEVYVEKILFDIEECKDTVSMWNGYELNRLFGIDSKTDYLEDYIDGYRDLVLYVKKSRFWEDDWSYPKPIVNWFEKQLGIKFANCALGGLGQELSLFKKISKKLYSHFHPVYDIKKAKYSLPKGNFYCGHSFPLLQVNESYDEMLRDELLEIFQFPPISEEDKYNYKILNDIHQTESVGIHIRRGDLLVYNGCFYENGYFNKAINYMRKRVYNPVWYIVSDEASRKWCLDNYYALGFTDRDDIVFVEGNSGQDNYKDLQLLSSCKHQIITNSSFGWWGCYLNTFENKITISPIGTFKTNVSI